MNTIDEMYYDKKFNEIEEFKSIQETDKKFRKCRHLLMSNLGELKTILDLNFNLFLALQLHLTVMQHEMQKLENLDVTEKQLTKLKVEDNTSSEDSDDEVGEVVKTILDIESSGSE